MSVMLPILVVTGLLYIFGRTQNQGIQIDDPEMDIRVRREIHEMDIASKVHAILTNSLHSDKRATRKKRQLRIYMPKENKLQYRSPYKTNIYMNSNIMNNSSASNLGFQNNSYYNNWRSNYTWHIISQASRQNNNRSYINKINNGFRTYNFHKGNMNFSSPHTTMPKFNRTGLRHNSYHRDRFGAVANASDHYTSIVHPNRNGSYQNYRTPAINNEATGRNDVYNYVAKPDAPGYLAIPEFKGVKPADDGPHWYNNMKMGVDTTTVTTTTEEVIVSACVICNIACPSGMQRTGNRCIKTDAGTDY